MLPFFLLLFVSQPSSSLEEILFVQTMPSKSHAVVMLEYAKILSQRGFQISFAIADLNKPEDLNVTIYPLRNTFFDFKFMEENLGSSDPIFRKMSKVLPNLTKWRREAAEQVSQILQKGPPKFMVIDFFDDAVMELAEKKGIPFVSCLTTRASLGLDSAPYLPDDFIATKITQSFWDRLYSRLFVWGNFLIYFSPYFFSEAMISQNWKGHPVITNGMFGFDYPRPMSPLTFQVGPVLPKFEMKPEDLSGGNKELYDWLSYGGTENMITLPVHELEEKISVDSPVFFVAFGSLVNPRYVIQEIRVLIRGLCAVQPHPRILFISRDSVSLLQETISSLVLANQSFCGIRVEKWVNQRMVLGHPKVKLFVTHGGMQSLSEAIYAEKPLMVVSFMGDQIGNGVRVEDAHIGVGFKISEMDGSTELLNKIKSQVEQLLLDPNLGFAFLKLKHLSKLAGGAERAADIIETIFLFGSDYLIPEDLKISPFRAYNWDLNIATFVLLLPLFYLILKGLLLVKNFIFLQFSKNWKLK